jgi:hypothetical protein
MMRMLQLKTICHQPEKKGKSIMKRSHSIDRHAASGNDMCSTGSIERSTEKAIVDRVIFSHSFQRKRASKDRHRAFVLAKHVADNMMSLSSSALSPQSLQHAP